MSRVPPTPPLAGLAGPVVTPLHSGEGKMNFEVGGFTDLKIYRNAFSMVKKRS